MTELEIMLDCDLKNILTWYNAQCIKLAMTMFALQKQIEIIQELKDKNMIDENHLWDIDNTIAQLNQQLKKLKDE